MSEISPTTRTPRALEIPQDRPGTTADELAERIDVTERAARRYVAVLREAGIPVDWAGEPGMTQTKARQVALNAFEVR